MSPRKRRFVFLDQSGRRVESYGSTELAARRTIRRVDKKLSQSLGSIPHQRRGKLQRVEGEYCLLPVRIGG